MLADRLDDLLVKTRCHAAAGGNHQKTVGVPRAVDQLLNQRHVAGELLELPAPLGRLLPGLTLETIVRLDAHLDERHAAVVPGHVAELLVEELGVVFAVLRHQLLVGLRHARLIMDRVLVVLVQAFAALDPAAGLEVHARMTSGNSRGIAPCCRERA